jgi:hypothetical protein
MKRKTSIKCHAEGCSREYAVIVAEFPWLLCSKCAKKRKSKVMCRRPREVDYAQV